MDLPQIPLLPDEILTLICEELGQQKDYSTLYGCALSCQSLADPALRTLYQYHELSPAFIQSEEIDVRQRSIALDQKLKQAEQSFRKWTLIWRSIVASSLDGEQTYKPYCRYLRILDFRNLEQMLEDPKFQQAIRRDFFKDILQEFHFPIKQGKRQYVDTVATVNAIGETVVPKTFLLEEISGNLGPGFLTRWIAHAPRLKGLVLFHGGALAEGAGAAIARNCEEFCSLTIREWRGEQADPNFARFLFDLEHQSLQDFEMISYNDLHKASFQALGGHSSLRELKLANLGIDAVSNLNALKGCTELHTLILDTDYSAIQLHAEVFEEVVTWLSSCEKLRDLTLKRFWDGPAILAQVAAAPDVRLTKLSLEGYKVRSQTAAAFHTALSEQKSLESVSLRGEGEDATGHDLTIMVQALAQLENLRELTLKDVSDDFEDAHIMTLALGLPRLEDFWTSGGEISADVLPVIANLKYLKVLNMYAVTQFKSEEILSFLSSLNPVQQKGFALSLMAADPEYNLTEEEQEVIQTFVKQNFDGRFEFVLWREAESSDSDDD